MSSLLSTNASATSAARRTALIGTALTLFSGVMSIIIFAVSAGEQPVLAAYSGPWDPLYIHDKLSIQFAIAPWEAIASIISMVAILFVIHAIWVLKRLYAAERMRSYASIAFYLFVIGVAFRYVGFLQVVSAQLGGRAMFERLDKDDAQGLKSLFITMGVVDSTGWMLSAFEILMVMLSISFFSYFSYWGDGPDEHRISRHHGTLGFASVALNALIFFFLIILICVTDEDARKGLAIFVGVLSLINGFLVYPAWLAWLGLQLGNKTLPSRAATASLTKQAAGGESAAHDDISDL